MKYFKFGFAVFALLFIAEVPLWGADRPNIVFVLADDMSPYEVGCYGQKKIKTPNIDRLAKEGMRFTDCASGNPVCAPSRCTILTGLHCGHAQVRNNSLKKLFDLKSSEGQWPLKEGTDTLPKRLKAAGYATGCFGKWGLGGPKSTGRPLNQGFDRVFGYNCQRHAHQYWPKYLWDNDSRVSVDNPKVPGHQRLPKGAAPRDSKSYAKMRGKTYAPDLILQETEKWLNEQVGKKPVFLFYATTLPHLALVPPDRDLEMYRGAFPEKPYTGGGYCPHPTPRAAYATMVSRMDRDLGRIVEVLKKKGEYDRTIFIFAADNGTAPNGGADPKFFDATRELRGCKGSIYRGGVTVPFVVRWPKKIAAGKVCTTPVWLVDLYPTLCEAAGVAPADKLDGFSLISLFEGKTPPKRDCFYWEFGRNQALRRGKYRWVRRSPAWKTELYDLEKDPGERTNLAKMLPELVREGERLMDAEHTPSPMFPLYPHEKQTRRSPEE